MTERAGSQIVGPRSARFEVWAPRPRKLELVLGDGRAFPMERDARGWARREVEGVEAGARYSYRLDGARLRPDPAAALLPSGVHGPAELVSLEYGWLGEGFHPPPLRDWTFYELHVGSFSPTGDFAGVERALGQLRELGVRALELMPVAPFPGARNWGYDGVSFTAVHAAYGGPRGLQRLVDAAHRAELAVVLDVVFNHLGPEGNYLPEFMPFFTDAHATPWGAGINFDGEGSAGVRRLTLDAALRWFEDFHVDALRLDAVHGIVDASPKHVLVELAEEVAALNARTGRQRLLIAESDLNQSRVVRPRPGGWGMDAQWSDDFHHALHARLTGERQHYYVDFGATAQLATALARGYVFEGERSIFRKGNFGDSTGGLPPERFVVCAQNHDQIGNRGRGERLGALVGPEKLRLAAALNLLGTHVPLLFMGEEYGERAPFQYFTSHGDAALGRAVREGRQREFPELAAHGDVPDPQDPATFERSRLDPALREQPGQAGLLALHRALLALRRKHPSLGCAPTSVTLDDEVIRVERAVADERSVVLFSFDAPARARDPGAGFERVLDTSDARFRGPGISEVLLPWSAQVWLQRGAASL